MQLGGKKVVSNPPTALIFLIIHPSPVSYPGLSGAGIRGDKIDSYITV
jgi:hypothetical protein